MKLLKMRLNNFQGVKNLEFDFSGKSASVFGDNATGKTTVFNAFTWVLFGKPSTGAKNYTPKTKGPDGDIHHLEHSAELVLETDNGRIVTLKKVYKEVYKKKRGSAFEEFDGHTIDYYVDDVPVKEKEYTANVNTLCGDDQDKPKMLTMPDYFSEQLSWDTRRKILLDICGDISDEDVVGSSEDLTEFKNYLLMPGTTDQFYSTDEYRKIATAKKSDIKKQLESIPSRIDEAERAIPDTEGLSLDEIERNINILEDKKATLLAEKVNISSSNAVAELKNEIADLKLQIAKGKTAFINQQNVQYAGIDGEIIMAKRKISEIKLNISDNATDIQNTETKLSRMRALREQLITQYNEVSAESWNENEAICPTCKQSLPVERIEKMREDFNLHKSKRLEEINQRGKTEASKEAIAELEQKAKELVYTSSTLQADLETAETNLQNLVANRGETPLYENTPEYITKINRISEIESKIADEDKTLEEVTSLADSRIKAVSDAIKEEQDKRMKFAVAENQRTRIAELEETESKLAGEFEELEKGLYLCDLFTKAKVSALTEKINERFKNVRFRLFQEQLNGGLKEDCEVMIPSADGRLVPYTFANNAARINAGLEIIDTLSEYWNFKMPVFIDNAESVTHLINTDTQTIRLVVSEVDKKLRMEVVG